MQAVAVAKLESHRDVMPSGVRSEPLGSDPTMIVLLTVELLCHRAEKECGPRFAVFSLEAQRPVLVLRFEGLALVPAFADQVAITAVLQFLRIHPRLDA